MGKFTVTHEIHCNAEKFWKLFFDKDFNTALFKNHLGFPEFNIVEQTENDTELVRRISGQPKMDMPGPIAKLLGSNFGYKEDGKLDKKTSVWRWKMTPSALADKLRNEGMMRIEPIGDSKIRRIAEITIEAKIFGVGGLLESTSEKQLRDGWDRSAQFMNDWLKKHP
ncbi:MAG: DUF2505 domain-containing protein [Myxococcales bacterium]|nr:DUF2505 domain-containing protein [Myxococcales bacterium]